MSDRQVELRRKFELLPEHEKQSMLLLVMEKSLHEISAERESGELKTHLDQRVVKAYQDVDTYEQWQLLHTRHRQVEADAIKDQSWQLYRSAIERHGNPPDQIQNFESAGIIMQDKQLQFAAAARHADDLEYANEIGMGGARGPGKSFGIFAQVTIDDCQRFAGLKVLYLRKSGKAAAEQILDLMKAVLPRIESVNHRERPTFKLSFENGSSVVVGHFQNDSDALSYQGLEYDIILIEELTHLSIFAYKQLRTSLRSSKQGFRPRNYVSFNPGGSGHSWVKKRFVDPEKQKIPLIQRNNMTHFIFATVYDNRFVNRDYRKNLEDLSEVRKQMFLYGNWDVSAGAFFRTWSYDYHVVDDFETIPPDMRIWAAMDYGFGHWNTIYLIGQTGERYYLIHELAHRLMYPAQIAKDIHQMLKQYGVEYTQLDYFIAGADVFRKTGAAEMTIQQKYISEGITLFPADNSPGSRSAGAQHIAEMLGDPANEEKPVPARLLVCRNCTKFIDTLPYLEHDPNNLEDIRKVDTNIDDGTGGDDAYDGARYGLFTPMVGSMASGRN